MYKQSNVVIKKTNEQIQIHNHTNALLQISYGKSNEIYLDWWVIV